MFNATASPSLATLTRGKYRNMVEQLRKLDLHKWVTSACAAVAATVVIGQLLFGAGGLFAQGQLTASHFQQQLDLLSAQVSRLADKIDQGPRADQLRDIDRHLSAEDGRMDALDSRMRDMERQQAGITARVDGIGGVKR